MHICRCRLRPKIFSHVSGPVSSPVTGPVWEVTLSHVSGSIPSLVPGPLWGVTSSHVSGPVPSPVTGPLWGVTGSILSPVPGPLYCAQLQTGQGISPGTGYVAQAISCCNLNLYEPLANCKHFFNVQAA